MKTLLFAASALAFAFTSQAQTTPSAPANPSTQAPAGGDAAMSPTTTSAPANVASATPTTAAPASAQTPEEVIATEFPTYDKDGNGSLSRA